MTALNLALATTKVTGGIASRSFGDRFATWKNVLDFGAAGDGTTDDSAAIQAALNAMDPNRGGTVYFPQGRYRIGTGLTVPYPGTLMLGEGVQGVSNSQANGSSRIISDNGITAITAYKGSHSTLGYAFARLQVKGAVGNTSGNGIVVKDTESCIYEDVTVSDYYGGIGLTIDGLSGNAQYHEMWNFAAGDCLTGIQTQGLSPSFQSFGGYFAGLGTTPRPGSVAVKITTGGQNRMFGATIQGWEKGYYHTSTNGKDELHGCRFEFCNFFVHIGTNCVGFKMVGGGGANSLLVNTGAGNIGIQLDSGASNIYLDPQYLIATVTPVVNNSGNNINYPTYGTTPSYATS